MPKVVLIGASNNPDKFGYKIAKNLFDKNIEVFLVNPKGGEILGQKVFKDISEIDNDFDIVNFVTQPNITLDILQNNLKILKNKTIWCQPGSINESGIKYLKSNFDDYILNSCIMLEKI